MIKSYFRIAINNLKAKKTYSLINILGLSVGMAACFLMLLFVQQETSYDQFHSKKDQVYRLHFHWSQNGDFSKAHTIGPYKLAPILEAALPQEVADVVRIHNTRSMTFRNGEDVLDIEGFAFADDGLFQMFDFELLQGEQQSALSDPNTLIITDVLAQKLFGDQDPVGKEILVDEQYPMKVTGVMKALPDNSHFHFSALSAMKTAEPVFSERVKNEWSEGSVFSYILLNEGINGEALEAKMSGFISEHIDKEANEYLQLKAMPLTDIHLHSKATFEFEPNGNAAYVLIFLAIAGFIILIASINYMNLATARSAERSKEVGLRKVVGAHRWQIAVQFLSESVIVSFLAMIFALVFAQLALPSFNELAGKNLQIDWVENWRFLLAFSGLTLVVGIVSGSYPAFYLSGFQPITMLKSKSSSGGAPMLRKSLVVLQFSLSIILIIGTLVINGQISFLHQKNLGITVDQVVSVPIAGDYASFKQELLQHPSITHVTATNKRMTGQLSSNLGYRVDGATLNPEGEPRYGITTLTLDADFFETYQVEVAEGRPFKQNVADLSGAFIFNESAIKLMGLTDPIGKRVESMVFNIEKEDFVPKEGQIIGVVKDFHFESLYEEIKPMAFQLSEDWLNWMSVKIKADALPEGLAVIEKAYKSRTGSQDFTYNFIDDYIDELYKGEERFLAVFTVFSVLSVLIACLGIFGLAAFTAEKRTKEIGIRKVLGCSTGRITFMLTADFLKLVGVAAVFGWPVAYFTMDRWLMDFTYRTNLGVDSFILATLMAMAIALVSVSVLALKAAMAKPVNSLRSE